MTLVIDRIFCIYIYIYIYIYIVLFGPVKPGLGVIPSGKESHLKTEHLNFPGREKLKKKITKINNRKIKKLNYYNSN